MIEIKTKNNDICNYTDVELKDVLDYCKKRMNDFLKYQDISEMHINLHSGKRDLLISYMRTPFYTRYIFNGIGYTYQKRMQGLETWINKFAEFVEHDANIKRT